MVQNLLSVPYSLGLTDIGLSDWALACWGFFLSGLLVSNCAINRTGKTTLSVLCMHSTSQSNLENFSNLINSVLPPHKIQKPAHVLRHTEWTWER